MKSFWDDRYTEEELAYGEGPNAFFGQVIKKMKKPGKLLLPMEGQGRNAIYAAKMGWEVVAFDFSKIAKQSALRLAEKHGVTIDYHISTMEEFIPEKNAFDAVAMIFAHLPAAIRKESHLKLIESLKNGGLFILEGFNKNQVNYNSGGPKNKEMLYSSDELSDDFKNTRILKCEEKIVDLQEGKFHRGEAAVIDLVTTVHFVNEEK